MRRSAPNQLPLPLIGHTLPALLEWLMSTKCTSNALTQTKPPANELSWGGGEQRRGSQVRSFINASDGCVPLLAHLRPHHHRRIAPYKVPWSIFAFKDGNGKN